MKTKSIIKKIRGKQHNMHPHIADIRGECPYNDPNYFENTETGELYSHIAGSIGFPGKDQKGVLLILGVERNENEKPTFHALDEFEFTSIDHLFNSIPDIRSKWGYRNCLETWYSDYERFMSILNDYDLSEDDEKREQIIISIPYDLELTNNFEIYYRQIDSCMAPDENGKKRLFLRDCIKTRNYLQNLPPDVSTTGNIESYPAVFAVGSLIHTLSIIKPWRKSVGRQNLHPTSYTDLASKEAITRRHLFGGRSNPGGDDLIPTIK